MVKKVEAGVKTGEHDTERITRKTKSFSKG